MGIHDCKACGHLKRFHVKRIGKCKVCSCNSFISETKKDKKTDIVSLLTTKKKKKTK